MFLENTITDYKILKVWATKCYQFCQKYLF